MGKAVIGKTITFAEDQWQDDSPKILRPNNHAFWLSSVVFDGARAIRGKTPDLLLHCERAIRSAKIMGLAPKISAEDIETIALEGVKRYPDDAELYISPMFYGEEGFITPDPESTRFVMSIFEAAIPEPTGFTACRTKFRRPAKDMAPTEAKASCLYPNVARGVREVADKGFDVGVVMDPNGNVAEFSYTNLFMAKNGVVHTPAINGTFLNGITRQRVIQLLTDAGIPVEQRPMDFDELLTADELFATGNYAKVQPCIRIEDRDLQPGPMFLKARELYFSFAAGN